jgi:nuclear pore complex protein Nup155
MLNRLNLTLNQRIEYLTLAVGNAKSQSATGMQRLESALRQLTDLEERLEVAQVQLELLNTLMPRINEGGAVTSRIELLQKRLLNITDVGHLDILP